MPCEILFIIGSVVARYELEMKAFEQRLKLAGKPAKMVRIAVAHKLLVRLNAKAREVRARLAQQSTSCSSLAVAYAHPAKSRLTTKTVAKRSAVEGPASIEWTIDILKRIWDSPLD